MVESKNNYTYSFFSFKVISFFSFLREISYFSSIVYLFSNITQNIFMVIIIYFFDFLLQSGNDKIIKF